MGRVGVIVGNNQCASNVLFLFLAYCNMLRIKALMGGVQSSIPCTATNFLSLNENIIALFVAKKNASSIDASVKNH
ncbi:MAG TPA: hypothetical protein QF836_08270 [Nitrospinota bacterium]|jgi:hypothetical protein|nr:hypothetical protein [Nitrospinota bacterium]